jgi:hypothetical protein
MFVKAQRRGNLWLYLAAGVFGGITILTKTIYIVPMAFLFAFAVWQRRPGQSLLYAASPRAWARPAMMIAGSMAALAVVATPIILAGALGEMVEALTYYSGLYSRDVSMSTRAITLLFSPLQLLFWTGPFLLMAIGSSVLLFKSEKRMTGVLLLGWFVSGLASIFLVGRYYAHYYAAILPAMALLIPPAFDWVAARRSTRLGFIMVGLVLPVTLVMPLSYSVRSYAQPSPEARHATKFGLGPRYDWEIHSQRLGAWLKDHTTPNDKIYNLGFEAELYFYADRTSPSRFFFDHAFGLDEKYEREAIQQLSADPPLYVVDSARYEGATAINYYSYPVHEWVVENYDYVGKIEYADVWRLKAAQ